MSFIEIVTYMNLLVNVTLGTNPSEQIFTDFHKIVKMVLWAGSNHTVPFNRLWMEIPRGVGGEKWKETFLVFLWKALSS